MALSLHTMDRRCLLSVLALLSCRSAALIVGGLRRHLHLSHYRLGCSVGGRKVEISRVSGSLLLKSVLFVFRGA